MEDGGTCEPRGKTVDLTGVKIQDEEKFEIQTSLSQTPFWISFEFHACLPSDYFCATSRATIVDDDECSPRVGFRNAGH